MLCEYNQRTWGRIFEDKALEKGGQTFLHFSGKKGSHAELNKEVKSYVRDTLTGCVDH